RAVRVDVLREPRQTSRGEQGGDRGRAGCGLRRRGPSEDRARHRRPVPVQVRVDRVRGGGGHVPDRDVRPRGDRLPGGRARRGAGRTDDNPKETLICGPPGPAAVPSLFLGLTEWITGFVAAIGYPGIFLLMIVEGIL